MNTTEFKTDPTVCIILVNWNQLKLTLDCLKSLEGIDYPNCQIILVDNGSKDGSVAAIREVYPHLAIIENKTNLGFTEANNIGMRQALLQGANYVLLLNNDTVVDSRFISTLVSEAEKDPTIGMVGSKMYYFDQPQTIWCAGNVIDWSNGDVIRLQADEKDPPGCVEAPRDVDFITACSVAIKRSVLENVGLMDANFFIYYSETDWCVRTTRHGYRIVYVPDSRIWHKVSAAMGTSSPATDYYMTRDALLFLSKNLAGFERLRLMGKTMIRNFRTILAYTFLPKNRHLRRNRTARVLALRDAWLGHWGMMGPDVAALCYAKK